MKPYTKALITSFSIFLLSACNFYNNSEKEPEKIQPQTIKDINLSGTWKSITETRAIKNSTKEYLSSSFYESSFLLNETNNGVQYNECRDYGRHTPYGIKTDKHFYIDPTLDGYSLQPDGTLRQTTVNEYDYSPGFTYESISTFSRISTEIELDRGTLVLNGPVSVEEYSHVCLWQVTSNIGVSRTIELMVRYGNSYLSLRLEVEGDIEVGTYQYEDRYNTDSSVRLDVSSEASEFWDIVNSNMLSASNVTIDISESTEERLMGTFSFTGQDDGLYSGEFEILF